MIKKAIYLVFFIILITLCFVIDICSGSMYNGGNEDFKTGNTEYIIVSESNTTDIDRARINSIITAGGKEKIKNINPYIINTNTLKKTNVKDNIIWHKYNSWDDLKNDKKAWNSFITDRHNKLQNMLFDWSNVFETMKDIVNNETNEYIGVIRYRNDKKTLYIHAMECSNDSTSTASYLRSVPEHLVEKYSNIPGAFLFHTHPTSIGADPFPSDGDILTAIFNSAGLRFFADCVISHYGIMVYFLTDQRYDDISKESEQIRVNNTALPLWTFSYDVIMAWNSINSQLSYKLDDRLHMLDKFGVKIVLVPSYLYVSDNYSKIFLPKIIQRDRFIDTKYDLLKFIEEKVKKEEKKVKIRNIT